MDDDGAQHQGCREHNGLDQEVQCRRRGRGARHGIEEANDILQGEEAHCLQQAQERLTPRDVDLLQQDEYLQATDQLRCIEAGYKKARKLLAVALAVPSQKLEMSPTSNYEHQASRKHKEEVVLSCF